MSSATESAEGSAVPTLSNTAMQFGKHAYPKVKDDFFVEPAWVVEALADNEPFFDEVWDPAAGSGTIPFVFRNRGYLTIASDIVYRGARLDRTEDFLMSGFRADNIVTNPPYSLAERFARHAIAQANDKVALLVSLTFLESQARYRLFTEHPPRRVWVCSRRPSMPPGDSGLPARGGKRPYCWVVWERDYRGPTQLCWLPPDAGENAERKAAAVKMSAFSSPEA